MVVLFLLNASIIAFVFVPIRISIGYLVREKLGLIRCMKKKKVYKNILLPKDYNG